MKVLNILSLFLFSLFIYSHTTLAGNFGKTQCTYYVKQVADTLNNEDCLTPPGCGFNQAVKLAENNMKDDVICIQGGTYLITDPITYNIKVLKDYNLKLIGDYSSQVVIDSKNTYGTPLMIDSTFNTNSKIDILIDNITFTSSGSDDTETNLGPQFIIFNNNLTIQNCKFTNLRDFNAQEGSVYAVVSILSSEGTITLRNNEISNNKSTENIFNIINPQGKTVIENNQISDNESQKGNILFLEIKNKTVFNANSILNNKTQKSSTVMIQTPDQTLYDETGIVTEVYPIILTNNAFVKNQTQKGSLHINDISGTIPNIAPNDIFVINNNFYRNTVNTSSQETTAGLNISFGNSSPQKVYIENNIFWENQGLNENPEDILLTNYLKGNEDLKLENNLIPCATDTGNINFNTTCVKLNGMNSEDVYASNNINTNPLFESVSSTNEKEWNLHLQKNSPCIDAGTYSNEDYFPKKDFEGKNRKLGNNVDIGIYESAPDLTLSVLLIGDGSGIVKSNSSEINCGNENNKCSTSLNQVGSISLTATPNDNSYFVKWTGDCSSCQTNPTCSITIDAPKSCNAEFALKSLQTVTLNVKKVPIISSNADGIVRSLPSGIDCGKTCSADFSRGQEIILYAIPDSNNEIDHWGEDCFNCGNEKNCKIVLDKNSTCTISFKQKEIIKQYTLEIEKDGTGGGVISTSDNAINCGNTCSNTFTENSKVTLTANPNNQSSFAGWSKDCSPCGTDKTCTLTITKNLSCKAVFTSLPQEEKEYSINFSPIGNGNIISNITCKDENNCKTKENTKIELIAVSGPNSYFVKWAGDCSHCNSEKCVIYLTKDTDCSAEFKPIPPKYCKLKTEKNGEGLIKSSNNKIDCGNKCETILQENSIITLTALPDEQYQVESWKGDCSNCGTSTECNVKLDSSKTCEVSFIKKQEVKSSSGGGGCSFNPNNTNSILLFLLLPAFLLLRRLSKA